MPPFSLFERRLAMLTKKRAVLITTILAVGAVNALGGITLGVYYAGGREIERTGKPGDTVWVEQAMVHTLIPDAPTGDPIIMVPGMGLGSYIYLGTPDGRKGWAQIFAEAGHPVYVYDIPEYSTSGGFDVNKCNDLVGSIVIDVNDLLNPFATLYLPLDPNTIEVATTGKGKGKKTTVQCPELPPTYAYWSTNSTNKNTWSSWGLGDTTDSPYPNVRYPVAQVDQLEKHYPLRYQDMLMEDVAPVTGDVEAEAIVPLCEKIGKPVILMIHSASAAYFQPLLQARPELFKALINVEQAFIAADSEPATVEAFAALVGKKPFLSVYADYIAERGQTARKELSQAITDAILAQGGTAGFIDLPAQGIFGNTHLMMQDNNNDVIAGKIIEWLAANVVGN
jgi:pimeloyl-ACP methyl ester carboxylesterase